MKEEEEGCLPVVNFVREINRTNKVDKYKGNWGRKLERTKYQGESNESNEVIRRMRRRKIKC